MTTGDTRASSSTNRSSAGTGMDWSGYLSHAKQLTSWPDRCHSAEEKLASDLAELRTNAKEVTREMNAFLQDELDKVRLSSSQAMAAFESALPESASPLVDPDRVPRDASQALPVTVELCRATWNIDLGYIIRTTTDAARSVESAVAELDDLRRRDDDSRLRLEQMRAQVAGMRSHLEETGRIRAAELTAAAVTRRKRRNAQIREALVLLVSVSAGAAFMGILFFVDRAAHGPILAGFSIALAAALAYGLTTLSKLTLSWLGNDLERKNAKPPRCPCGSRLNCPHSLKGGQSLLFPYARANVIACCLVLGLGMCMYLAIPTADGFISRTFDALLLKKAGGLIGAMLIVWTLRGLFGPLFNKLRFRKSRT